MFFCCLLHSCVAKLSGSPNPKYDSSAFELYLNLAESGNCKGYFFFPGNMGLISLWHARRIFAKKKIATLIILVMDETVDNLSNKYFMIW